MRKKRKTFLSEIWDSVILTQSVLQLEFVVWYISQVSNSYLSLSTVFHRFQKQAHWAKLLPDYNLRATCHRVFTQMFHQLTRIAIWSHCSPVNIISWELPSMIFTPQPNITQFYRGQFYYIKEYSYCMPGSIHVYCILGSLKREISLEFETYISQWHCRIQVIWSA